MVRTVTILAMTSDRDIRVRRCAAKLLGSLEPVKVDTSYEAITLLMEEDKEIANAAYGVLCELIREGKNLAYIIQNLFPTLKSHPSKALEMRDLLKQLIDSTAASKDDEVKPMTFKCASELFGVLSSSEDINHKISSLWILSALLKNFGSNEALQTSTFDFLSKLLDENGATEGHNSLLRVSHIIAETLIRLHFPLLKEAERFRSIFIHTPPKEMIEHITEQQPLEAAWRAHSKVLERLFLLSLKHPDEEIQNNSLYPLLLLMSTGYQSEQLAAIIQPRDKEKKWPRAGYDSIFISIARYFERSV